MNRYLVSTGIRGAVRPKKNFTQVMIFLHKTKEGLTQESQMWHNILSKEKEIFPFFYNIYNSPGPFGIFYNGSKYIYSNDIIKLKKLLKTINDNT